MNRSKQFLNHMLMSVGLITLLILSGSCKRRQEPNKIIDSLPVNSTVIVAPAQAAQQMILLKRDAAKTIVPVINRLSQLNQTYPEVSGPDGQSQYTFQKTESHYGTANFTIQFRDSMNNIIDPIQSQTSTSTLSSVLITVSGSSPLFAYNESLTLTLETAGNVDSRKRLTGTSNFTGSSYSITYTIPTPGSNSTFEGLTDGNITGSGSGGPGNQTTTLSLSHSADHTSDGAIAWEGQQGGIHFEDNGNGTIVTNQSRIFIQ